MLTRSVYSLNRARWSIPRPSREKLNMRRRASRWVVLGVMTVALALAGAGGGCSGQPPIGGSGGSAGSSPDQYCAGKKCGDTCDAPYGSALPTYCNESGQCRPMPARPQCAGDAGSDAGRTACGNGFCAPGEICLHVCDCCGVPPFDGGPQPSSHDECVSDTGQCSSGSGAFSSSGRYCSCYGNTHEAMCPCA